MELSPDVFRERFLGFHPKLYRIAFALLGNAEEAEDKLQDLYLKLWTKRNELSSIQQPEAYCVTLLKNSCMDHLRSPKAQHKDEVSEALFLQSTDQPEKRIEANDELNFVRQLINRLPVNQQQVLRLRSIDDCSMEEIEALTGLTYSNIRTLLSRARKTIKEQFNKLYTYDDR